MMENPEKAEEPRKRRFWFSASHYSVAGIAGLLGGLLLQGPDFPLKPGAMFNPDLFISYTLLSTVATLAIMRLNYKRE